MADSLVIEELWAFVTKDENGDEGLPAFFDKGANAWMPMVGADRNRIESLRPIAQSQSSALGVPISLVRFRSREEVEVIEPGG